MRSRTIGMTCAAGAFFILVAGAHIQAQQNEGVGAGSRRPFPGNIITSPGEPGDNSVEWGDMIGTIQPGNPVGSGMGQVTGAGQPFSVKDGSASVNLDTSEVEFELEGLTFAGGNAIGTTGPFTQVQGVLICDTNGSAGMGNSVRIDLPFVPLGLNGNAEFSGEVMLDPVCMMEPDIAFLILNPGNMWVAAAVRKGVEDDDSSDD